MTIAKEKQRLAYILTFAGAIPFVFLFAAHLLSISLWGYEPAQLLFGYAALIASFISGIHWGLYLLKGADINLFIGSNILTLIAWLALVLSSGIGAIILAACFLTLLCVDHQLYTQKILERWYLNMRLQVSLVVISILLVFALVV